MRKRLQNRGKRMPVVAADAQRLIWAIGEPGPDTNQKGIVAKAARRLGWTFARTSNMYRGRARIISADEWIKLNEEAAEMAQREKARQGALHELDRLAGHAVARIAAAMDGPSPRSADGVGHEEVEQPAVEGRARPDLLKGGGR